MRKSLLLLVVFAVLMGCKSKEENLIESKNKEEQELVEAKNKNKQELLVEHELRGNVKSATQRMYSTTIKDGQLVLLNRPPQTNIKQFSKTGKLTELKSMRTHGVGWDYKEEYRYDKNDFLVEQNNFIGDDKQYKTRYLYKFNSKGQPTQRELFEEGGRLWERTAIEYENNDRTILESHLYFHSDGGESTGRTTTTMYSPYLVEKKVRFGSNGSLEMLEEYEYSKNGELVSRISAMYYNDHIRTDKYVYNEKGLTVTYTHTREYLKSAKSTTEGVYKFGYEEFDKKGNWLKKTMSISEEPIPYGKKPFITIEEREIEYYD